MQPSHIRLLLALHRSPNLTDDVLRRLILAVGNLEQIFSLTSVELDRLEIPASARLALTAIATNGIESALLQRDWQSLRQRSIKLIPISHADYPELLKAIHDPPPILYVIGNTALLNQPQLAMVGSRRCSRQHSDNAFRFARDFARAGFVVTSGMALGIDAQSHLGALAAEGATLAVMGTGVNCVYPARNAGLYQEIATKGAIISELPLDSPPRPHHFPRRNRLISGMSLGLLVVEAALKSGSLISARCALEQGREVFALPGSIHSTGSRGCHALIQQGAKLVETTDDVLEELAGWLPQSAGEQVPAVTVTPDSGAPGLDNKESELLEVMGFDPVTIDMLQLRCGWSMSELTEILTRLEIKGRLENQGGLMSQLATPP